MMTKPTTQQKNSRRPSALRVGIVVPHIFMQRDILPHVIFSPARLALLLAEGLASQGVAVTLFTPGPVDTQVQNYTADLSLFEAELAGRGDSYMDLLKKHPLTFINLARQVQGELIARAYAMANQDELDIVHIYTNEEDIALPFAQLCAKPVVFTHHDPFNFLIKYKNVFPKYSQLHWLSMAYAQRQGMPPGTNWLANIYHGLPEDAFQPQYTPRSDYVAYLGRIIESKGVHLAIAAVQKYNQTAASPLRLRIAGKHYAGAKDRYWLEQIAPAIDGRTIVYDGFVRTDADKQAFLGNALATIMPSTFAEPFGMVAIESLACATPVIGLNSGALPEVITDGHTGFVVVKGKSEDVTVKRLTAALGRIPAIDRSACRAAFEARFTAARMCTEHLTAYTTALTSTSTGAAHSHPH